MDNSGQKNFKTSLCTHWLFRGACQRSTDCHFAHGIDELQVQGRNIMESHEQQLQLGSQQWRVKPCKWHQQGYCRYGSKCTFLHSDNAANDMGDRGSSISISHGEPRASGSNENGNGLQQAAQLGLTDAEMQLLKMLLKKINVKAKSDANGGWESAGQK